ncbi:hypothetical protein V6N11_067248 [Hibiscus sabdariffa]|uniref:Uncharacterized protein n=1 Tax=Hibiscus sabdariffa TaxID=183260 RepID=A0ABR2SR46_9ROSI
MGDGGGIGNDSVMVGGSWGGSGEIEWLKEGPAVMVSEWLGVSSMVMVAVSEKRVMVGELWGLGFGSDGKLEMGNGDGSVMIILGEDESKVPWLGSAGVAADSRYKE